MAHVASVLDLTRLPPKPRLEYFYTTAFLALLEDTTCHARAAKPIYLNQYLLPPHQFEFAELRYVTPDRQVEVEICCGSDER